MFYSSLVDIINKMNENDPWINEQKVIEAARKKNPELFTLPERKEEVLLNHIGIKESRESLQKGYIKLYPTDFIVEEILQSGVILADEKEEKKKVVADEEMRTVYADMIKVGLSTLEAVLRISQALNCDIKQIGYAGIKDAAAITSQRISVRNIPIEKVKELKLDNIYLKNIYPGKGVMTIGELKGNRFTIFIRTESKLGEHLESEILKIKEGGVVNYFGPQRFGSPRYLSHVFGKAILQGNLANAIKVYITEQSQFEWPFFSEYRKKLASVYGNWPEVLKILEELPYTFRYEIKLAKHLLKKPSDYLGALKSVQDQMKFWLLAYSSYLANYLLSSLVNENYDIPKTIPLLISKDRMTFQIYEPLLAMDGTQNYLQIIKSLSFIGLAEGQYLETKFYPKIHSFKILPAGLAISFDLPKGAYATTMLMNLFDLSGWVTLPASMNQEIIDVKKALGEGSLKFVFDTFKKELAEITTSKKIKGVIN